MQNRKQRKNLALLLAVAWVVVLHPFGIQAQDDTASETYSFYRISCGSYIERRDLAKESSTISDTFYVTGWLSAYARFVRGGDALVETTDIDSILLWLENYCREQPLSSVESGLYKLASEARARPLNRSQDDLAPAPAPPGAPMRQAPKPAPLKELKF